ncbi:MAG TPA: phytoene/squalene synthase family protein [Candidatus Udaeobacter sp.]|nr:phytoene/squalene synthase family protein [Candidatus Udaeobacter sp.]
MNSDPQGRVPDPRHPPQRLQTTILRSVSRSFYLSIRVLPTQLREPIALAYLLARTTDTVADTSRIPGQVRLETLKVLSDGIRGKAPREMVIGETGSFIPLQENPAEQTLLASVADCLKWLEQIAGPDRDDIRVLLEKITHGQMLDLHRFDNPTGVRALQTAADLDEYTYLVAGCVGEFWTRLCFRHIGDFTSSLEEEMLDLGRSYGMGLQLINILRDAGNDLRAGRCYFPEDELRAVDLSPAQILSYPDRFQSVYQRWVEKAQNGLEFGMQYSRAVRNRRVRAATVLPALIGVRTLTLLRKGGRVALHRAVKIPRAEVRRIIMSLAIHLGSIRAIDGLFSRAKS